MALKNLAVTPEGRTRVHTDIGTQRTTGASNGRFPARGQMLAPLALAVIVLAGCGGDDKSETANTSGPTTVAVTPAQAAPPSQRESVLRESLVEGTARGKKTNRFFVRSVDVDGGDVRVRTGGYPEDGAGAAGRGACAWIAGAEPWMESIEVVGEGGVELAAWEKGDKRCSNESAT